MVTHIILACANAEGEEALFEGYENEMEEYGISPYFISLSS
jgi:hypothetical protein